MTNSTSSTIAVYAASFDPLTVGHMSVIEQVSKMFDKLVILVATNPAKENKYMFSAKERHAMVTVSTTHLPNVATDILYGGYTIRYAESIGATVLVRGLRNEIDFEEEKQLFTFNNHTNPAVSTIFIMSAPEIAHVSSSYVKNNCYDTLGWLDIVKKYVPAPVISCLAKQKVKSICADLGMNTAQVGDIIGRYACRPYHNLFHIIHILEELSGYTYHRELPSYMPIYNLATLYHDLYVESDTDIDDKAQEKSIAQIPNINNREIASRLISYTAYSDQFSAKCTEEWQQAFMDADFSILGQSEDVYDKYAAGIRQEYARFTDAEFKAGRIGFLQGLLAKDYIFFTEHFAVKYEVRARKNIARELTALDQ